MRWFGRRGAGVGVGAGAGGADVGGAGDEPTVEIPVGQMPLLSTGTDVTGLEPAREPSPTSKPTKPKSGIRVTDLLGESIRGMAGRPARLVLTMLGTVIGIAAVVATLGLGQTAASQVTERFDAVAATRLTASPVDSPDFVPEEFASKFALPWDAEERAKRLAGVTQAGSVTRLPGQSVTNVALLRPGQVSAGTIPVLAVSPGIVGATGAKLATGRFFDAGMDQRQSAVAVLGLNAAQRLGVNRVDSQPSIFVGGRPYAVIGILSEVTNREELMDAVLLPNGVVGARFDVVGPAELEVRTAIGATQQVAKQLPLAMNPNDPSTVKVKSPPPPGRLGTAVLGDVNGLFLGAGALALIVGSFGIANVTLLSVMERSGEIGLRRALGARRKHIAAQFLLESGLLGLIGGLIGSALGILTVVLVCVSRDWTAVLDIRLALFAPLVGALVGLLAGAYPSMKAAATEPITALRQSN